ncbi:MAG TPA: hypothetical protein PKD05_02740 [Candidatus Melainabacteria bacterium]|nr:hypothetical protein [Candidatus Melainabacteria bacterium]
MWSEKSPDKTTLAWHVWGKPAVRIRSARVSQTEKKGSFFRVPCSETGLVTINACLFVIRIPITSQIHLLCWKEPDESEEPEEFEEYIVPRFSPNRGKLEHFFFIPLKQSARRRLTSMKLVIFLGITWKLSYLLFE